ncbi:MAG: hypothetical protein IT219_00745 [Bacteroidales bacterium]|nr:hypothetical protein [Bacteroidales bacterium]
MAEKATKADLTLEHKRQQPTKGFTSAGLTGQASQLLFLNLAFVRGLTERYSATEFVCNYISLIIFRSKQDIINVLPT